MLKESIKLSLLIFILIINVSYAYDWLRVEDPQRPWRGGQGSIEEAIISVRPRGIYMEFGLYLTFSAKGLDFSNSDTLEIQFYFDLPENAIVHDSWLWIGNDIIRAKIMDKWTAAAIYEDIVSRRRDPSILFKRSQRQYELRIFPMAGNESRKVKITYLAPTQWNSNNILASLPTNLLRTSKYQVSTFYLLTWLDHKWKNPKMIEFPDIAFYNLSDSTFGNYVRAEIPSEAIQSTLNFAIDSPLNNGIYLSKFENGNEGLFQMVFLPSQALNLSTSYKVALLFDYDASKSNISENEIINNAKSLLHSNFSASDCFNLIFSHLNIKRASENWLYADSTIIENTFSNLGEDPLADYSNLPSLLANGIDFIKNNGNDGSLLLISNSDQVGDYQAANQLIDDLLMLMDPILPIHVADFQNQNYSYHWIGGRNYYGNEYFYTNITRLTTGNYYDISGYSFSELLSSAFQSLSGFMSSFDLHTRLKNGFCYARFNLTSSNQLIYLDRPILQIGKYNGTFPFVLEASGVYKSEFFSQQFEVQESDITTADSLSEEIWIGNYIKSLESQTQTNAVVSEIIDYSIDERVLSIYSAFICLEPERGGEVCYDCLDESSLVGIEEFKENANNDSLLQAYPNPFNTQTTIKFTISNSVNTKDITFRIYDILGQVVRTFTPNITEDRKSYQLVWDGRNESGITVSSGNYFFIISTPQECYVLKLLLIK